MSDTPIADELAEQLEAGWVVHQWPDHQEGQINGGESVGTPAANSDCGTCGGTGTVWTTTDSGWRRQAKCPDC